MINEIKKMSGGCMCGEVRYDTTGDSFSIAHCHCHSCRKHNGAPVVTLAGFRVDQVNFTGVERTIYESSSGVGRAFCGKCGTPLTWEGDYGDLGSIVEFHIGTFDNPDALIPTAHLFYPERIQWFEVDDKLPRYEGFIEESSIICFGPICNDVSQD